MEKKIKNQKSKHITTRIPLTGGQMKKHERHDVRKYSIFSSDTSWKNAVTWLWLDALEEPDGRCLFHGK